MTLSTAIVIIMKALLVVVGFILGHILTRFEESLFSSNFSDAVPQFDLKSKSSYSHSDDAAADTSAPSIGASGNVSTRRYSSRIMCMVLTTPANHMTRARHVGRTWGRRCDKILFYTSQNIFYEDGEDFPTVQLDMADVYTELWQKSRLAFTHVHKNYASDFDWIMKADDDTYVIMENLRHFLSSFDPRESHYLGSRLKLVNSPTFLYNAGGPGYILSRPALKKLVEEGFPNSDKCTQSKIGSEDLEVANCLLKLGIFPADTVDSLGKQIFMPFKMSMVLPSPGFTKGQKQFWINHFVHNYSFGQDFISPNVASFHNVYGEEMHVWDYLLYQVKVQGK